MFSYLCLCVWRERQEGQTTLFYDVLHLEYYVSIRRVVCFMLYVQDMPCALKLHACCIFIFLQCIGMKSYEPRIPLCGQLIFVVKLIP